MHTGRMYRNGNIQFYKERKHNGKKKTVQCIFGDVIKSMQVVYARLPYATKSASARCQDEMRRLFNVFDGAHLTGTVIIPLIFSESVSFIQIFCNTQHES